MLININKHKSNFLPKKGSFRKIQENYLRNVGLLSEENATPEQLIMFKKYKFMYSDPSVVDVAWIKKNNMEKVWSRKSIHPVIKKLTSTVSAEIKKLGGVDESNADQLKQALKKHVSTSKGWTTGDPFQASWELKGASIQYEPVGNYADDFITINDMSAEKEITIDVKDGKINTSSGGMGGWPFPAANAEEAKEGANSGYII